MFFYILLNNIAPVFALVVTGYYIGRKFNLDIFTLSKINFYVFIPSLIFVKIYEANLNMGFLRTVVFTLLFVLGQYAVATVVARLLRYEQSRGNAFKNAVTFYNTGNIGLPLITLIFAGTEHAEFAVTAQVMILVTQNLCTFTLGFFGAAKVKMGITDAVKTVLKVPVVYTIALAFVFRLIPYNLQEMFLWPAILYARQGMIPVALLSLGIQLSLIKVQFKAIDVYIASFMRLCLGPFLAYTLVLLMNIDGILAQVLLISSAVPTAINTALIAVEVNNQAEFATQAVVTSTILSSITLPVVIYLAQQFL